MVRGQSRSRDEDRLGVERAVDVAQRMEERRARDSLREYRGEERKREVKTLAGFYEAPQAALERFEHDIEVRRGDVEEYLKDGEDMRVRGRAAGLEELDFWRTRALGPGGEACAPALDSYARARGDSASVSPGGEPDAG